MTGNLREIKNIWGIAGIFALLLLVIFVTELTVMEILHPRFARMDLVTASLFDAGVLDLLYAVPLWCLVVSHLHGGNEGEKSRTGSMLLYIEVLAVIFLVEFLVMLSLPALLPGVDDRTRNVADAGLTILFCALPLWRLFRPWLRKRGALLAESLGTPLKLYFILLFMVFLFDLMESQIIPLIFAYAEPHSHMIFDAFLITFFTAPVLWLFMVRPLKRAALMEKTRFDALQAQIIDALMVVDVHGKIKFFNPAAERIFGYAAGEIVGNSATLLLHDDKKRFPEIVHEITACNSNGVSQFPFEVLGCCRDGSTLSMEVSVSRVMMDGRQTFLMIMRDISDRKKGEAALRESERRFREIYEQTEDAIIFFKSGTCYIIDINSAAEKLYGYTRAELKEEGLGLICRSGSLPTVSKCISGIRRNETASLDNIAIRRKEGEEIVVSMRGKLMTLQNVDITYCSFRDITKRIRMEEEAREIQAKLIQVNKMTSLGLLVSGVAHEINNPNNFIMANAQLLAKSWEDILKVLREYGRENGDSFIGGIPFQEFDANSPQLFAGIIGGARRINEIIGNLKGFARQERLVLEQDVDVNQVVTSAVTILHHEIVRYTGNFRIELAEEILHVKGSKQQLGQVMINLLMNACQALPDRQSGILLETGYDAATDTVTITVMDEGCGMSPGISKKIMEPFFTTKLDNGGTGLGLSISQSIVKDHNGFLEFKSEPGKGTTFFVRIPALHTSIKEQPFEADEQFPEIRAAG